LICEEFAINVSHAQSKPNVDPFDFFAGQMAQTYASVIVIVTEL
jgi:hypothetical protein